jgi:hypothetical protein
MVALERNRCTVLSLDNALACIATGKLPERAVVLTFDDGSYDFYKIAWPILKEFRYPATLYLTTYYVDHPYPVPPGIWGYLLWKARGSVVNAHELFGQDIILNLKDELGRTAALRQVCSFAKSEKLSGLQKNLLSAKLAQIVGVDFGALCSSRILHAVNAEEVRELAGEGVSVQMHTHHHSNPGERENYIQELQLNRERIKQMTGLEPIHFCYPNGVFRRESVNWVRDWGVESATTCHPGLFRAKTDPLLIPRLMVGTAVSEVHFEGWLVGFGALFSPYQPD